MPKGACKLRTMFEVQPVTLEGNIVRLEPVQDRHAADLAEALDNDIFQYFAALRPQSCSVPDVEKYLRALKVLPNVVPFAVVLKETGKAVGSTTYMDIRAAHRGLEIGMTWYGKDYHGTLVNPEAKLLLLEHAFERLGCVRVQLKTDGRNLQSQRAIEKLGAKKEGVLRRHMIMFDGFVRDTVMYSILPEEWPDVKAGLLNRLGRGSELAAAEFS